MQKMCAGGYGKISCLLFLFFPDKVIERKNKKMVYKKYNIFFRQEKRKKEERKYIRRNEGKDTIL